MRYEKNNFGVSNTQTFQGDLRNPQLVNLPSDSTFESVKQGVQDNRNILLGMGLAGIAAGATLYFLRTERGRELSSQIGATLSDSMCKVQESVSQGISKIKDSIIQMTDRWNTDQSTSSIPSTSRSQLRRVV